MQQQVRKSLCSSAWLNSRGIDWWKKLNIILLLVVLSLVQLSKYLF